MPGIHIPPQSGLRISGPLSCNGITIYSAVITVTSLFTATVKWLACYRIATIYQKIPGNYPENVRHLFSERARWQRTAYNFLDPKHALELKIGPEGEGAEADLESSGSR